MKKGPQAPGRIRLISTIILCCAVLLVVKLYLLQIVHGQDFADKAERQYVRPPQYTFDRGSIYFQDKNGELVGAATVKTGFIVTINPKQIKDAEDVYKKLSAIITLDHDAFIKRAVKNDTYEEVAKQVDDDKGKAIDALDIPGVTIYTDRWRVYPGGTLAAQVLGFMGYQGDTLAGRYGLERSYSDVLTRNTDGAYVNFFAEIFSDINKIVSKNSSQEGNIVTTIEPNVQAYLEKQMAQVNTHWGSEQTGGIIINPKTGEIYAMSLYPTFDPNNFQKVEKSSVFTNFMVENVAEMGSIIKPLTMAAGIDSGTITPDSTYDDTGCIMVNKSKICNYDLRARGVIPMQQILSQSLNVGVSYIATKMGSTTFASYFRNFGLGEKTGIDLPNEATGIINNLNSPRQVEFDTASFGQGIAITPLETVRALSALGNGGTLVTPHIVKQIDYSLGYSKVLNPPVGKRVISAETSAKITKMLTTVVDTALLNGKAKNPHYSVAAKTGTAQIADPVHGGYYEDRYLHSFFGYFPSYNPQFLVFMYTVYPKGVQYASETLTEPFLETSKFLINYYEVPPDR